MACYVSLISNEEINQAFAEMSSRAIMKVKRVIFKGHRAESLRKNLQMMPHVLGNLKVVQESQTSLSTKMASVCTSQQVQLLWDTFHTTFSSS